MTCHTFGTTFSSFQSPYVGSRKEPDFFLRSDSIRMPKFVIETGWSESLSRLQHDMNLWLVGGVGDVGAVLLLKWKRIGDSNKARGNAELYALDRNGIPVMEDSKVLYSNPFTHSLSSIAFNQAWVIFPMPSLPCGTPENISISRRLLLGLGCQGLLDWDINDLRRITITALGFMGLVPA